MDIRQHSEKQSELLSRRRQPTIQSSTQEGLGNALRAAFTATNWSIPEDMRLLLERMDR